jgi:transcriptional regulator with XRE-family HTH domain
MRRIHLRAARERAKLTQEQLAEKSGVNQRAISKLELIVTNPSFDTAVRLGEALAMDPRQLKFGPREEVGAA